MDYPEGPKIIKRVLLREKYKSQRKNFEGYKAADTEAVGENHKPSDASSLLKLDKKTYPFLEARILS